MVSAWQKNGSLSAYLRKNPEANRVILVCDCATSLLLGIVFTRLHLQLEQAASALAYLHSQKLIHGDIKAVRAPLIRTHNMHP